MENQIVLNFNDIAERASEIDIHKYQQHFQINRQYFKEWECSHECYTIKKGIVSSLKEAIIILFLIQLYDNNEWWSENYSSNIQWKKLLRTLWIPQYFVNCGNESVKYHEVTEEYFKENNLLLDKNIALYDAKLIENNWIHIFTFDGTPNWNDYQYIIETNKEYILFSSSTSA
jgi:hypothetical protein